MISNALKSRIIGKKVLACLFDNNQRELGGLWQKKSFHLICISKHSENFWFSINGEQGCGAYFILQTFHANTYLLHTQLLKNYNSIIQTILRISLNFTWSLMDPFNYILANNCSKSKKKVPISFGVVKTISPCIIVGQNPLIQ